MVAYYHAGGRDSFLDGSGLEGFRNQHDKEPLSMHRHYQTTPGRTGQAARSEPRRICVVLDKGNLLCWHLWLIDSLSAHYDVVVSLTPAADALPLPPACRLAS